MRWTERLRPSPELRRAAALGVLAAAVALGARASAAPEAQARSFVQQTIDQVLGILHDDALPLEAKKDRVEEIAYARFDFPLISRLVVARNWSRFSAQQKSDFIDAFKKHLSATYRDTLNDFKNEKIEIVASREESNGDVTVMTMVRGATSDVRVDYRLRNQEGGWRGIDVIIEGVSLVQNFRSQAQEIVSTGGPELLIQKLRDKQISSPRAAKS